MDEWPELCCPKYSVDDKPCSAEYEPGPEKCEFPAVKVTTYETNGVCENRNCPIATCTCDKCVDASNHTHDIGTIYPGADHCENFTCLATSDELCPSGHINRIPCNILPCDSLYEKKNSQNVAGECCPKESCECKSYEDLQDACENWKNDTSTCPDEKNMVLQTSEREYVDNKCCPVKSCICKEENDRNCEKGADYECPANHDRVQTIFVDETHCCPDYECVCNCSHVSCPYGSWTVKNEGDVNCECQCECEPTLCKNEFPIPNCEDNEDLVQMRTEHGDCCPVYECVCNTSKCPKLPSANCSEYQIEYGWKSYVGACCADMNKCVCNPNSTALTKLCNETQLNQPQNCSDGWEPYIAGVMAGEEDGLCCDRQCRCISCMTDSGDVKMVGSVWEEEKDCKILQHICSNEKLSNTCHQIKTNESPVPCAYDSLEAYEAEKCEPNFYALVSNQTECCPEYECVTCATSSWTCESITKERIPNATHPRCPGECICADLGEALSKWCYSEATCGHYQEAVSAQGAEDGKTHDDECCPIYKCICSTCPNDTVTEEDVIADSSLCEKVGVRPSDVNKECCKNYELQCDESCTCPELNDICVSTVGCFAEIETNTCNCPVKQNCQCREGSCPVTNCPECQELTTTQLPVNPDAACSGNCCPNEECVPIPCNISSEPVIPAHCGFLKKVDVFNDDPCCPDKELTCGQCPSDITQEICGNLEGYINVTIPVANSTNEKVLAIADCPMVDDCCPLTICLCHSCPYEDGIMFVGERPRYSSDGCTKFSCDREVRTNDGCYKINEQTPSCPPSPPLECYQTLKTEDALKGATNMDEWPELCCPKYSVDYKPCSEGYEAGPEKCEFPAVKVITYEINEGCENKKCPIATCTCDKCLDATNQTHDIGTIYPGADHCENFTCLAGPDKQLCPSGVLNRIPCYNLQCNSTYEIKISEDIAGKCCPVERCDCKSEDDMQSVCDNWLEDTSHCTDPEHMELIVTGSRSQHKCCPEKTCRCKDPENRNCAKDDDYECPGNYTTVKKANATSDNCCPEFDCTCDCSGVECEFSTWSAKTSEQECDCRCSCDLEKCPSQPTCPENMLPIQDGMTDGNCCPTYRCKCDNSTCSTHEKPCKDYRYQYERRVYDAPDDCCPVPECICKGKSDLESLGCRESCSEGYQKTYNDSITKCCGQCECTSCLTSENTRVEPGVSWNTTEDNCQVTRICSDSKLANGCHAIETTFSQKDFCQSKEDYLANYCVAVEVVRELALPYECCPRLTCECTENNTVLSQLCEHHNGIECSDFKYPAFMGQYDCCNTYECSCRVCEYSCPLGYIADRTERKNASTDDCCDEYSCICDTNYCQTLEDYETENCDARFEVAVNSSQFLQSYPCCTKYECVCKTKENCPSADELISCLPSQEPVVYGKLEEPSNCCDNYTCVCKGEDELGEVCPYPEDFECIGDGLVLRQVKSQDPCCHNFTCTCIQSTCSQFCLDCPLGKERREVGREGCCTKYDCQWVSCVVDGVEHPVNTSWTEDSCNIHTCIEGKIYPIVTTRKKYECAGEGIEDCEKRGGIMIGTEETDGCCKECTLCKRVSNFMNVTKIKDGVECVSIEPVDIGSCQGACPTVVNIDPLTGVSNAVCACCEPTLIEEEIMFECGEGVSMEKVKTSGSCKCTNE